MIPGINMTQQKKTTYDYGFHKDETIDLTMELMRRASVTPEDADCQKLMADRLTAIGFTCEHLRFEEVDNLWAHRGDAKPSFVFAGHTDVVPSGPHESWQSHRELPLENSRQLDSPAPVRLPW